ncbi:hypothetical protein [uncultured Methanobrevibacter sp.]|jgi:hypothetical protein|uniref:hypothetical protein n=1 Tax=uncultured Methanobrevibacter sp. TaxID=253161 RepID=UPI00258ECBFA|nr:hypothetical protein [uncultured Methanobrevibacter sp.]
MKLKYFYLILSIFLIIMVSVCSIVAVDPSTLSNLTNINNSQDNAFATSNDNYVINSSMQNQNNVGSDNQSILKDDELNTTSTDNGGIRNISLTNGYNGYCINMSLHSAESGQTFTITNTSSIINHLDGSNVGEYIKILFYNYWDIVNSDKTATSDAIWRFTDMTYIPYTGGDYDGPVVSSLVTNVISDYNNGLRVPDHGAVKKINDTSGMVFDFICLISGSDTIQNYFGYKVTIQNITQNNTTDFNNTNTTGNNTNNTNTTNSTNNNTDNSNNITNSTNGNDTSTTNNNTLTNNNQNNKTGTGLYNTGNPLYILFAALMLLTALPFYRKK